MILRPRHLPEKRKPRPLLGATLVVLTILLIATPSSATIYNAIIKVPDLIRSYLAPKQPVEDPHWTKNQIQTYVLIQSRKHQVSPQLVWGIIAASSQFDQTARSPEGAIGLMQVMPSTGRDMGLTDVDKPGENIEAGVKYLAYLLKRFRGDTKKAVAAYRYGPGIVERSNRLAPNTAAFVERVLRSGKKLPH